ncbi:NYN domain-containing protein [Vibrio breoganii]|uniref:Nuclease n=1 Tax=Vibrio breoganii TaxID=553239 RepID=A0AAN1CTI7_9VIBR|nr:NYN domain-containing protein [Vibrio breoganii]ANO34698.1 nuclease [Vibrio breoganii]OCH74786.1 nuclease [Vibrio breoganii]OED97116.1 nuclease [Vibrio breoganii ZF-29]OEF88242.1 nuclease [Vibrio breoganii 1C10]PMG08748.1 nuclease [Vibrio breoganii]
MNQALSKRRVAIFADVQNIYYTTRDAYRRNFDYNAFWALAMEYGEITSAQAYAIASHDPKQRQFHHILRGIGFEVKLKPYIQRSDGSAKGDWDVGITIDIMERASEVDTIILLSGDGDFELLVKHVAERYNCHVVVLGVPQLTANALKEVASEFIGIQDSLLR